MRVLVFGDSIAQGFFDENGGWVESLKRHSSKEFTQGSDYLTFFNMSISGDFTKDVLARLENELQARVWPGEDQVILFAIGANDSVVVSGKNAVSENEFEQNLKNILSIAKRHSSKIIFLGLSPVVDSVTQPVSWDDTISYSNERTKLFNDAIKSFCKENNLSFVNVYDPFISYKDTPSLFDDGIHPNAAGHELIFKTVFPEFNRLIEKT